MYISHKSTHIKCALWDNSGSKDTRETQQHIQYCRNVVQPTQFADSFLLLGYVISKSNLVFSTPKYPFDTEHNDTN